MASLKNNREQQKVIIIGATSGIGEALAKRFYDDGCRLGISGRRKELLELFQTRHPGTVIEPFDVMGNENIMHLGSLIERLGGLDLLIYNSGYGEPSKKLRWDIDQQTTLTNVNGFIEIAHFAFNYFLKQGAGHLVGISSIAANRGSSIAPAYNASKAFMSTYLEGLSIKAEHSQLPLTVTDIQPGFVRSKMAKGNKQFWSSSVEKATNEIWRAIKLKKRKAYITRRWRIIAILAKVLPYWFYKKFV